MTEFFVAQIFNLRWSLDISDAVRQEPRIRPLRHLPTGDLRIAQPFKAGTAMGKAESRRDG